MNKTHFIYIFHFYLLISANVTAQNSFRFLLLAFRSILLKILLSLSSSLWSYSLHKHLNFYFDSNKICNGSSCVRTAGTDIIYLNLYSV